MRPRVFALLAFAATAAGAQPYLVSDPTTVTRVTHCVYTRGTTVTEHAVEAVTGGKRCKIDLAADARSGTVSVAFKDQAAGEVGPAASFTFPVPLAQPANLRLSN